MSMKPTPEVLRMLIERKPYCLTKAAEAEAAGKIGMSIYWRTLAGDADVLYAYMVNDDPRQALATADQNALTARIRQFDTLLRVHAVSATEAEAAA